MLRLSSKCIKTMCLLHWTERKCTWYWRKYFGTVWRFLSQCQKQMSNLKSFCRMLQKHSFMQECIILGTRAEHKQPSKNQFLKSSCTRKWQSQWESLQLIQKENYFFEKSWDSQGLHQPALTRHSHSYKGLAQPTAEHVLTLRLYKEWEMSNVNHLFFSGGTSKNSG